jgi:hypothetical protein
MQKAREYRFVIQVWDNHAHLHKDHQVKPALELNAVASTAIQFDLDIADGQNGAIVPDHLEETEGAFTVANLNDTNSDGIPDVNQNPVMGEKDLMKLVVRFGNTGPGGTAILKAIKGANLIRIWEKDDKSGHQISLPYEFNVPANQKIPYRVLGWIEGIQPSNQLQDIVLELEYQGKRDRVAATLIWAERTNFRNSGNSLSPDADGEEINRTFRILCGSTLGLTIQPPPVGVQNAMEMEFTVKPPGIRNVSKVIFDITRQAGGKIWRRDGKIWNEVEVRMFPAHDEEPNDDDHQEDEDNIPTNNHIYSIDGPRIVTPDNIADADEKVFRANFFEFVRVKIGAGVTFQNQNGIIEGSRCSPKIKWRSRIRVERGSDGKWKRKTVDPHDNEIVEGWLEIGSPPF